MRCRICALVFGLLVGAILGSAARADDRSMLADLLRRLPAEMMKDKKSDVEIVDALFSATLRRAPKDTEKDNALKHLQKAKNREVALQDIVWALMNTKEFVTLHGFANLQEAQGFIEKVVKAWEKK